MRKDVKLESNAEIREFNEYSDDKLAIAKVCVLSTAPNSHHLNISEEVLRRDIGTIRGNFLVADMVLGDATTHTSSEVPVGYFMQNEPIEFEEFEKDGNTYLRAWAYAVLSKQYAKSAYEMFVNDNHRATSIEMKVEVDEEDENKVISFDAYGSTILGKSVAPSCKEAEISLVRFAEDANTFFNQHKNSLTSLQEFVKKRKESMAEKKTYKIDKSKEAMSTSSWSEVDKTELRNKIIEAKNAATLVKSVYLKVDEDWSSAPSEKLHYPVMQFEGDTLVYNKNALANAKARAVQNNETAVVTKIEKIYKSLGLDDSKGKEEDAKMAKEIEFAAVDIGDMWERIYNVIRKHDAWDYCIEGVYEQDNKKFAVLRARDGSLFRLDFSLTEEGMIASDELIGVQKEFIETDTVVKFAEPEDADKYKKFEDEIEGRKAWGKVIKKVQDHEGKNVYVDSIEDDHIIYTKDDIRYRVEADIKVDKDDKSVDAKIDWDTVKKDADQKMAETVMSAEDMKAEMERLQKEIEDRDNIIMEKEDEMAGCKAELEELRQFKAGVEKKEQAMAVESVMAEVKEFIDDAKYKEFREEGLECKMSELDGWTNKVKAFCFENGNKSSKKKSSGIWSFSAVIDTNNNKPKSIWED